MPALRCISRKLRRFPCSPSRGDKRRNREGSVSHERRDSEHAEERRTRSTDCREKSPTFAPVHFPSSQWPSNISPPKNPAAPINEQPTSMVVRYNVNARREGLRPTRKRHVAKPTIRVKAGQTK